MQRNKYIAMFVLLTGIILLTGCPGGAGNDGNTPDGSPLDPDLNQFQFTYKGASSGGGYYTEVALYNLDTPMDSVVFWINDASDSAAIDPGPYTFDPTSAAAGKLTDSTFLVGYSVSTDSTDWSATRDDRASYESRANITTASHDQIVSGSVLVSKAGTTYTLTWDLTSADGDTISGNYTGLPSIVIE